MIAGHDSARALVRAWIGVDAPADRDVDYPCPSRDFAEGVPSGTCDTDGHYMCRECSHASPAAIAERDEP